MKEERKELLELKVVEIPSVFGECLKPDHFELFFKYTFVLQNTIICVLLHTNGTIKDLLI